jgi:Cof subfamily protein (haloacid dehalogenase superfamily)
VISYHGKVIFKSLLKTAIYQDIIRVMIDHTDGIPILCGLDAAVISATNAEHIDFLSTFYSQIKTTETLDRFVTDADKLTIYFPNHNSKSVYEEIFKPRYGADLSVTVGDTIWIDIMNKDIDKGKAIAYLGQHLGLMSEQMMAFGDTYNDIEMLEAVKYSYLVANASDDMSQYAQFVTDSNDNYGVSKVIQQVIDAGGQLDV